MPKTKPFYKKPKWIMFLAVILIAVFGAYAYFSQEKATTYDTVVAERGDIVQEVSVTGRVEAAHSVNLAFERTGRISHVYVDIGDTVKSGDKLVELDHADLLAQFRQAQAGAGSAGAQVQQYEARVAAEEAKLSELKRGTRREEIQIAETAVSNAEKVLADAEKNLEAVKDQAEVNLEDDYNSAFNILPQAITAGKTALFTLTDIQYANFNGYNQESIAIESAKAYAVEALVGGQNGGRWSNENINKATGGAVAVTQEMLADPSHDNIDLALTKTLDALYKTKIALDTVPVSSKISSTERTELDTEKTSVNTQISNISNKQQLIAVQKITNDNAITTAEAEVNSAQNSLTSAKNELNLKRAGSTAEQIKAQEAAVKQAQAMLASQKALLSQAYANVQNYQAQINKTVLRAPISGIITRMEAKVGEIVTPSASTFEVQKPLVSLISEGNFEIKANVAEVDIAKIKLGDEAVVTLDAYGSDVEFQAMVTAIDPAETIVEGVSTYEITLQFNEPDERIKSGMTANLDILTAKKENAIAIPQRAVINRNGDKTVRLLVTSASPDNPEEEIKEVSVKTGLRSSDGQIEITEGIEEGDNVILYIRE